MSRIENLSSHLMQYNMSPVGHGNYGSTCHAQVFYSEKMSGERSLKFLLRGAYLPRKIRVNSVFKDRWIWVNPFLNGLCWNRSDTLDNYKKQDFTGFAVCFAMLDGICRESLLGKRQESREPSMTSILITTRVRSASTSTT